YLRFTHRSLANGVTSGQSRSSSLARLGRRSDTRPVPEQGLALCMRSGGLRSMPTPTPWGTNFTVTSVRSDNQYQQHVGALTDGRIVEAWLDSAASLTTLKFRLLNADGSFAGNEAVVNIGQTGSGNLGFGQFSADYLAVTGLRNGGFVVTWSYEAAGQTEDI